MMKRNRATILLLSIILVLGWIKSVPAEVYLASNPTEFQNFLTLAQASADNDTIKLKAGVYNVGNKLEYVITPTKGNLTIEQENPGYDVFLNGGAAGRILEIRNSGGTNEIITITGITFQNAIGTALNVSAPNIEIKNCKFINNTPDFDLSPATRLGGGAELTGKVTLKNNIFDGNQGSPDMCGGATIVGGPFELDSNIFVNNTGGGPYLSVNGGGLCIRSNVPSPEPLETVPPTPKKPEIILTNNVFDANTCSAFYGCPGGLYISQNSYLDPQIVITNNTFINNTAMQTGAAAGAAILMSFAGVLGIHNNIFWDNFDSSYPPVLRDVAGNLPDSVTLNVTYNLFFDSSSQVWTTSFGNPITPNLGCDGGCDTNVYTQNPGLSFLDYHLIENSPCIDAGDNSALALAPATDIDGDDRKIDDPAVADTGNGTPPIVDIGADEYTPPQAEISVSPTAFDFPDTIVMQSSSPLDVIISNIGQVRLDITGILLDNTTDFSLDTGTCGTNINIVPGENCTVSVTFSPQTVESLNASLIINSTDPDSLSTVVFLSGYGDVDTDGDGIGNKADPDDDNDGLPDEVEENILGTNPLQIDTDGNGTPDGDEDADGDGFTNIQELQCDSDPADPNSRCGRFLPFLMLLLD